MSRKTAGITEEAQNYRCRSLDVARGEKAYTMLAPEIRATPGGKDPMLMRNSFAMGCLAITIIAIATMICQQSAYAADDRKCCTNPEAKLKGRIYSVISNIDKARSFSALYQRVTADIPINARDADINTELCHYAGEALDAALKAYFFLGPVDLKKVNLQDYLAHATIENLQGLQYPKELSELVKLGYIDSLSATEPVLALPQANWSTAKLGALIYTPINPKQEYLAENSDTAYEGYILMVVGNSTESDYNVSQQDAAAAFMGDLTKWLPEFPSNIAFIAGIDPDTV
jgi:hypothetical protein